MAFGTKYQPTKYQEQQNYHRIHNDHQQQINHSWLNRSADDFLAATIVFLCAISWEVIIVVSPFHMVIAQLAHFSLEIAACQSHHG